MESLVDIPFEDYRDGIFKRLGEVSERANLTREEQVEYNANLKWARDYYATMKDAKNEGHVEGHAEGFIEGRAKGLEEGRTEGLAEGLTEGRAEKANEIALKMKNTGMAPSLISQLTGLSETDIANL